MKSRTNRNQIKSCILVLLLCLSVVIGGCGKETQPAVEQTEADTAVTTEAGKDADTEVSVDDSSEADQSDSASDQTKNTADSYPVAFTVQNTWGDEGNYGGTYNVSFTNQGSSEVNAWKIEADVPDGSKVSEAWGCEVTVNGTKAVITAIDWGAKVAAGQKMDVGFNMDTPSLFTPSVSALYVDGAKQDSGSSVASNSNATTEDDKTTATEADRTEAAEPPKTETGTPLANHGALRVNGVDLVDKNGDVYQLRGVSTHGLAWFPEYVNKEAFQTIRDDWGGNVVRLAMYSDENGGYCSDGDKNTLKSLVEQGVEYATELGMYVIIDWHVLGEQDPLRHQDEAKKFFDEMSRKYASYDNVLYEICNEPNGGVTWSSNIRPYAETIIPVIRANDKDAVIIVGTPNWSQDVDVVANDVISNPIPNAGNVMYALHFYAATHTDSFRSKLKTARNQGLPIFISECSICDASGNGANDYNQADQWFQLINEYHLSYCTWSLCNKAETSALIRSDCTKTSGWTEQDLSETGKWIRKKIRGE